MARKKQNPKTDKPKGLRDPRTAGSKILISFHPKASATTPKKRIHPLQYNTAYESEGTCHLHGTGINSLFSVIRSLHLLTVITSDLRRKIPPVFRLFFGSFEAAGVFR